MSVITSFCGHLTFEKHYEMKHEMTQWKCFVPDTPSFYDHTWFRVEFFCHLLIIKTWKQNQLQAMSFLTTDLWIHTVNQYWLQVLWTSSCLWYYVAEFFDYYLLSVRAKYSRLFPVTGQRRSIQLCAKYHSISPWPIICLIMYRARQQGEPLSV